MSGTGYQTEYQYLGMENDGFAYYGGNRYYSPIMGRMLSLQGPLASAGGFGSGVGPVAGRPQWAQRRVMAEAACPGCPTFRSTSLPLHSMGRRAW